MWVSFSVVGFHFGGMGFMDQWMGFIFRGVGGWVSSFLGSVVVVFVGWWQLRWIDDWCGFGRWVWVLASAKG